MKTRREALAAAAGAALVLRPGTALALGEDRGPLSALVAFEQLVAFSYDVTLSKAPLRAGDRPVLERFRAEAADAVAILRRATKQDGGAPPPPPDPALAPPLADPSRKGYLRDLVAAEENAVARYYAALHELVDTRHLAGSAALMAASGRRLVILRQLAGEAPLPRAFETGSG
jgi:hypothetical protein